MDSETVTAFQKTAVYHVLVVAGLHVGALAVFFFWLGRKFRFSVGAASLVTLLALAAYVGMVQDRPPILRAALMVALYLCARPFFSERAVSRWARPSRRRDARYCALAESDSIPD